MLFSDDEIEEMLNNIFGNNDLDLDPISLSDDERTVEDLLNGSYEPRIIKCECGADKCKLPFHSDYCPKYKKL